MVAIKYILAFEINDSIFESTDLSSGEIKLFRYGTKLNFRQSQLLDASKTSLTELRINIALLGYYSKHQMYKPEVSNRYYKLLAWFIKKYPNSLIHQLVSYDRNDENFHKLRRLWLRMVRKGFDRNVIENAAHFSYLFAIKDSRRLWQRAREVDSKSVRWTYYLAKSYAIEFETTKAKRSKSSYAVKSIEEWKKVIAYHWDYPGYLEIQSTALSFARALSREGFTALAKQVCELILSFDEKNHSNLEDLSSQVAAIITSTKNHI